MSMEKLIQKFYEHIFPLLYYNRLILEKWPDFFLNDDGYIRQKNFNQHLGRPFYQVTIPGIITTFIGLTIFIYVNNPAWCRQYSFWLLAQFPPDDGGQIYTLIVAAIWSLLHMLQMFYGYRTNLRDFDFLIVLNLDPETVVRKENGNKENKKCNDRLLLNANERQQLKTFKRRMFFILKLISHSIAAVGYTAIAIQIVLKRLWELSFFWLIFWSWTYATWSYYICSALYQFPTIAHLIFHYIRLKQKSVQKQITRLNQLMQSSTSLSSTR